MSETAIIIDNVTNTSLALANTQFIESRVQEDDIEIEKKIEDLQKVFKKHNISNRFVIKLIILIFNTGLQRARTPDYRSYS